MGEDRSWMYRRRDEMGYWNNEFNVGVEIFLDFAFSQTDSMFCAKNMIRCPCMGESSSAAATAAMNNVPSVDQLRDMLHDAMGPNFFNNENSAIVVEDATQFDASFGDPYDVSTESIFEEPRGDAKEFFDLFMEHLAIHLLYEAIHLPYEARVGRPVQFRWMYPFESTVDNPPRNIIVGFGDNSGLSIFKCVGKCIGSKIGRCCLMVEERKAASYYVLMNCEDGSDDEPPIPQQINIDDIAYELMQYSDGRFIEIHEEVDVGEGSGEEDEEGEWEDFETLEQENIETYVEENDSGDE
ncbi:hypothetical protein SLE2022_235970 [Rubroshorea leprosula]